MLLAVALDDAFHALVEGGDLAALLRETESGAGSDLDVLVAVPCLVGEAVNAVVRHEEVFLRRPARVAQQRLHHLDDRVRDAPAEDPRRQAVLNNTNVPNASGNASGDRNRSDGSLWVYLEEEEAT